MRWQTLLKVGAVAAFAQTAGGNFSSSNFNGPVHMPHMPVNFPAAAVIASFFAVIAVIVLLVGLAFFYLGSRLQFVLFDIVLRSDTTVAPRWRYYGPATWRWMGLRFLFILIAAVCLSPIVVPAVLHFIHAMPGAGSAAQPDFGTFIGPFLAFFGALLLFLIVVGIGSVLLRSFGLPSMALEATPLGETVARVFRLIRAEPLQILLYIVMRVLLQIVGGLVIGITFVIGMLILLIPVGGVGGILWAALHHGGIGARFFMWFVIGLLAIAFVVAIFIASFMLTGVMETFFQAYALYFLGGRYPLLGEILQPTPPPSAQGFFYPPPPFNPAPPPPPEPAVS
jgi:hypothetical protein